MEVDVTVEENVNIAPNGDCFTTLAALPVQIRGNASRLFNRQKASLLET